MSQSAGAADDYREFLSENGETVTLTSVTSSTTPGVVADAVETVVSVTALAWISSYGRRETDGERIMVGDQRCWVSVADGDAVPAPGWRVVRSGTKYQVMATMDGPSHLGPGLMELQLRRDLT